MADVQSIINNIKTAAIDTVQVNYFQFEGRAARPVFWWSTLAAFLVHLLVGLLGSDFLSFLAWAALFLPMLGLAVRRLHDINLPGWYAIGFFVPLVNLVLLLYWGTRQGSAGANDYGPAPANPLVSTTGKGSVQ